MKLYIYSKCSTCQNALKFLAQKKVAFERQEITETPPSVPELETMLKFMKGDLKKLFNTSGQLYRELQLSEKLKEMSEAEALILLTQVHHSSEKFTLFSSYK
ncbi:MAG: arsenate reductase family protein [Parachlamydiaceae bacterium]|nr:arsenate reductase family protein [Parachlamydiaceae bacterium]